MKRFLYFISMIALAGTLSASTAFIERAVKVKTDEEDAIRLYEVERKTETLGNYSATTIEYIIENKTSRVLQGELEFPLMEGENVSGFSLDINGIQRKAVAIEKQKGRKVFESIVRRGIDPGLVEKTEGNNFKTRIYPIPAKGVRHFGITIEREIVPEPEAQGNIFTQTIGKDTFFYFYEPVEFKKESLKKIPSFVTVLFDVSDSGKNRDIEKEIDFLKKYVSYIEENKKKASDFELTVMTFSNEINEVKTFGEKAVPFSELEDFLKGQFLDGATSYDFNLNKISADEILLFTDGIENWKNGEERNWNTNIPVHTICSASSANFLKLRRIADEHNGVYLNLTNMDAETAVSKFQINPLRVLKTEFDPIEVTDLFPQKGSCYEDGVSVTGILKRKEGKIRIFLGRNGKTEKIIEKNISAITSIDSEYVSRLWAMKKVESLEEDKEANKNEIIALAKKYTIVTEDMSLIVLERESDYINNGIELPEDLKKKQLKASTGAKPGNINDRITKTPGQNKLDAVYRMFEAFKEWWNAKPGEYPPPSKLRSGLAVEDGGTRSPIRVGNRVIAVPRAATTSEVATASSRASEAVEKVFFDEEKETSDQDVQNAEGEGTISLQAWDSDAEYLAVLKKTPGKEMYAKYMELKKTNSSSPAFYMEVSDYFAEEGFVREAERILSNLAEMNLENTDVLRALGNKLVEREDYKKAAIIFEKLTKIRSDKPAFFRDYALACNLMGEKQKAIDALWHIVTGTWEAAYSEIQMIALNDMNAIIAASKNDKLDLSKIDPNLIMNFDSDIRIVLTWNTDDCDIDLWVTDPDEEKCYYGHKYTDLGGRMSRDFTMGYGPEEFMIKKAPEGAFRIESNYYGNHQQKLLQPVIVQAEVYTNFGRPNQKRQILTLQLDDVSETFYIGEVEF